jgi:hypothetical protein
MAHVLSPAKRTTILRDIGSGSARASGGYGALPVHLVALADRATMGGMR